MAMALDPGLDLPGVVDLQVIDDRVGRQMLKITGRLKDATGAR
jgi:hypothetical protein